MNKTFNNKAWWLVLPVFLMVAFNALVPLMTVVNYSIQETFGNNEFFWSGTTWFEQILHDEGSTIVPLFQNILHGINDKIDTGGEVLGTQLLDSFRIFKKWSFKA